jgi:hypothetical protein
MSALRRVVQRHVASPALAGGTPGGAEFDRRALQRELERMRRSREIAFWICVGLLLILFVGLCLAAVAYREDPAKLSTLSTAMGVTLAGVVGGTIRLWEQKVKTDLVMSLASSLSEDSLKSALSALLTKL